MILQVNILLKLLKKNLVWFLILVAIIILEIVLIKVRPPQSEITTNDFFVLIGYPFFNNGNFISILILFYQFILIFYIIFVFLKYDFLHSFENIILRINSKSWIFYKSIVCYFFIIIAKTFQVLLIYIFFKNKFDFSYEYLVITITYSLLISSFVLLNINFSKLCNLVLVLIEIMVLIIMFENFNFVTSLIICLIIFIYNLNKFKFKKSIKLRE